jgi:hypothetical protein
VTAINIDSGRTVTNLEISGNTMAAGWDNASLLPSLVDVIRGISLSATSSSGGDTATWKVTNNLITGVTQGIRVRWQEVAGTPANLDSADISDNSITVTRCGWDIGFPNPCVKAEILNQAPALLTVSNNW